MDTITDTTHSDEQDGQPAATDRAREYLEDAPGDTPLERARNAIEQARRDRRGAMQTRDRANRIVSECESTTEILEGVKRRIADDAAGAVLDDDSESEDTLTDSDSQHRGDVE